MAGYSKRFLNNRFMKICLPDLESFDYDLDQEVNYDPKVELNITEENRFIVKVEKPISIFPELGDVTSSKLHSNILKKVCETEKKMKLPVNKRYYNFVRLFKNQKETYKGLELEVKKCRFSHHCGYITGDKDLVMTIYDGTTPYYDWTYGPHDKLGDGKTTIGIDCSHVGDLCNFEMSFLFGEDFYSEGSDSTFKTAEWVMSELKSYVDDHY